MNLDIVLVQYFMIAIIINIIYNNYFNQDF